MGAQRFGAIVLGSLGGIAVLLTILGTYVLAESMTLMRLREMGIRAALGATGRQLGANRDRRNRATWSGWAWSSVSDSRGWGQARSASSCSRSRRLDPVTLAVVAALILTLALLVSLRPALRAARVDLASVLKD
jgi:hypothetical protein